MASSNPRPTSREMTEDPFEASVLERKTEDLHKLYKLGRKLGQGRFGATYYCEEKATGKPFACKTISKTKLVMQNAEEDVRREIQIMHHLCGHPNVVMMRDAYEDDESIYLVMELCSGGDLFDQILMKGQHSEAEASALIRTIVAVISACHSLGVMHRNLKPQNFLWASREKNAPLKTTGFHFSVFFKPGEKFTEVVGSPDYVAPEVLNRNYGPEADIWSAGVILYILLTGIPPFWGETASDIFKKIVRGKVDYLSYPWSDISSSAKDLVKRILDANPKTRITAKEVLAHPWIAVDGMAPTDPSDLAVQMLLDKFLSVNKTATRFVGKANRVRKVTQPSEDSEPISYMTTYNVPQVLDEATPSTLPSESVSDGAHVVQVSAYKKGLECKALESGLTDAQTMEFFEALHSSVLNAPTEKETMHEGEAPSGPATRVQRSAPLPAHLHSHIARVSLDQFSSSSKDQFKNRPSQSSEEDKLFSKISCDTISTDFKVLTAVGELQSSYTLEELMFDAYYTEDLMWDPVKASDGKTYDRWTIIEHDDHPNGHRSLCDFNSPITGAPLTILCDDITVRQRLYTIEKFKNQGVLEKSKEMREKYRTMTLKLVAAGHDGEALERLEHVLKWAPKDDVCCKHRDAISKRLAEFQG